LVDQAYSQALVVGGIDCRQKLGQSTVPRSSPTSRGVVEASEAILHKQFFAARNRVWNGLTIADWSRSELIAAPHFVMWSDNFALQFFSPPHLMPPHLPHPMRYIHLILRYDTRSSSPPSSNEVLWFRFFGTDFFWLKTIIRLVPGNYVVVVSSDDAFRSYSR